MTSALLFLAVLAPLVFSRQVIRQEVPITALTLAILAWRASFGAAPGRGA